MVDFSPFGAYDVGGSRVPRSLVVPGAGPPVTTGFLAARLPFLETFICRKGSAVMLHRTRVSEIRQHGARVTGLFESTGMRSPGRHMERIRVARQPHRMG